MDWNIAFYGVLIFDALLLFGMIAYAWYHLEARGARSLLVALLCIFGFNFLYIASLYTRTAFGKQHLMYFVYMTIFTFPLAWLSFVQDLDETTRKFRIWGVLPFGILNALMYAFIVFPVTALHPLVQYHSCETYWIMNLCLIDYSPWFWILIGVVLLEILYGLVKVIRMSVRAQSQEFRQRYLMVAGSVFIFVLTVFLTAFLFNDIPGADPLPVSFAVFGLMLFTAFYFQRVLAIVPGRKVEIVLTDDLLITVNMDHYITDINMATLQVFDLDVKAVIDVQLEHAFLEFPEVVALFDPRNPRHSVNLDIDGTEHTFEAALVPVREPYTNDVIGHRMQLRDVTERPSFANEVTVQAVRDPLTHLYTKASFLEFGEKLRQHTARMHQPMVLVLIDIDDFKLVNRSYSHLVGDQALAQLVEIINNMIRSSDLFARWESDELVLLLPKADEFMAYQICTRIKESVAAHHFIFTKQEFQMTVSMGYTVMEAGSEYDMPHLLQVANMALVQSRTLGRNRLTFLPANTIVDED